MTAAGDGIPTKTTMNTQDERETATIVIEGIERK
jgi:hypothetical protein